MEEAADRPVSADEGAPPDEPGYGVTSVSSRLVGAARGLLIRCCEARLPHETSSLVADSEDDFDFDYNKGEGDAVRWSEGEQEEGGCEGGHHGEESELEEMDRLPTTRTMS